MREHTENCAIILPNFHNVQIAAVPQTFFFTLLSEEKNERCVAYAKTIKHHHVISIIDEFCSNILYRINYNLVAELGKKDFAINLFLFE